jgi:hypothetical protein
MEWRRWWMVGNKGGGDDEEIHEGDCARGN